MIRQPVPEHSSVTKESSALAPQAKITDTNHGMPLEKPVGGADPTDTNQFKETQIAEQGDKEAQSV